MREIPGIFSLELVSALTFTLTVIREKREIKMRRQKTYVTPLSPDALLTLSWESPMSRRSASSWSISSCSPSSFTTAAGTREREVRARVKTSSSRFMMMSAGSVVLDGPDNVN